MKSKKTMNIYANYRFLCYFFTLKQMNRKVDFAFDFFLFQPTLLIRSGVPKVWSREPLNHTKSSAIVVINR